MKKFHFLSVPGFPRPTLRTVPALCRDLSGTCSLSAPSAVTPAFEPGTTRFQSADDRQEVVKHIGVNDLPHGLREWHLSANE